MEERKSWIVVTRKAGEAVVLTTKEGLEMVVIIKSVGRSNVKVAVGAPRHVNIRRAELELSGTTEGEEDATS